MNSTGEGSSRLAMLQGESHRLNYTEGLKINKIAS
jgi:hypothetical protein